MNILVGRSDYMISCGDIVVYGTNGVCRFNGEVTKKTAFGTSDYFELESLRDRTNKMYLPKNQELLGKLRRVMTYDEAVSLVDESAKEQIMVVEDDNERKERFSSMLKANDSAMTVRVVRALTLLQKSKCKNGRKLHSADERMLKLAKKMIDDELSYALGIEPDTVPAFVSQRCKKAN